MAKFKCTETIAAMERTGMVPVFYHADIETAKNVLRACYDGGVRVFEFTNRGDFAQEVFAELVKYAARECPEMILGIGSIVDAGTAAMYLQLGANFVVGPLLNPDIARVCNRRLVPYIPGCATPSEVGQAQELGSVVVKIFPAGTVGGPAFVKNIKAPMPWANIMVTGGVEPTAENLTGWFKAGVSCVGMGSNLFPKATIDAGRWDEITALCSEVMATIRNLKN